MNGSSVGAYSVGGYSAGGYSEPTTDFGCFGSMCSIEGIQCGGATVWVPTSVMAFATFAETLYGTFVAKLFRETNCKAPQKMDYKCFASNWSKDAVTETLFLQCWLFC